MTGPDGGPRQLTLPIFPESLPPADSAAELARLLGAPVRLVPTDNRRVVLSWRRTAGGWAVRLRRELLAAPAGILTALARHLASPGARTRRKLLQFLDSRPAPEAPRPRRAASWRLRTRGSHHDLAEVFARLNGAHFGEQVRAGITWGRQPASRRRRSIRFGSYHPEQNLIRIHPALDRDDVPGYFVEWIVHHEMLHAHLGVAAPGRRRRSLHGRDFRARERAHPEHDRAERWLRENLARLLR